jgi:hypothetical protein
MSLVGLRADATRDFSVSIDPAFEEEKDGKRGKLKEGAEPTLFTLGTLTARVQVYLRDQATKFRPDPDNEDKVVAEFNPNAAAYETVRFGLKAWGNFTDEAGSELKIVLVDKQLAGRSYKVVSEESMDLLHADVIREISEELTKVNTLSEEEAKNSEG